nr:hypothetical protein [Tanacetum cinerariifolium]
FNSALQNLREVDFPLLVGLKSHKDASTKDIMNVLRLEGALADGPGMNDLQPHIEQLKGNHCSTTVSPCWCLDPFVRTLICYKFEGEASTSGVVPAAFVTTTALSTTFASASSIPPISTDDYEIVSVDGQEGVGTDSRVVADVNVSPFPNVDNVGLNIPQRGQEYNWETATYGNIWYDEDVHYLRSFEKEFPAIVYNDALTSEPEVSFDFENEYQPLFTITL